MGDLLNRLPVDIVFDIAILCNNYYYDYCNIAEVVLKLDDDMYRSRARSRLTVRYADAYGEEWKLDGRHHREEDLPACTSYSSTKLYSFQVWYKEGIVHRDNDLPAAMYGTGRKEWYRHGLLHRDNGLPAVTGVGDTPSKWYINGVRYYPLSTWSFRIAYIGSMFVLGLLIGDLWMYGSEKL